MWIGWDAQPPNRAQGSVGLFSKVYLIWTVLAWNVVAWTVLYCIIGQRATACWYAGRTA
jgi:hypothetical protein